jgi:hypothetical protein
MTESLTYFLFARPSFWAGTAALFDFGNTLFVYNESLTTEQADYYAMKADWRAVGNDLRRAIKAAEADKEGVSVGGEEKA